MKNRIKKAIALSIISFPISYIITAILWKTTSICEGFTNGLVPTLPFETSMLSIVIIFNVIAVIIAFINNKS